MSKRFFVFAGIGIFVFILLITIGLLTSSQRSGENVLKSAQWYSSALFAMSYPEGFTFEKNPAEVIFFRPEDKDKENRSSITVSRLGPASVPESTIRGFKKAGSSETINDLSLSGKKTIVISDESQKTHYKTYYVYGDQSLWELRFAYSPDDTLKKHADSLAASFQPNEASR